MKDLVKLMAGLFHYYPMTRKMVEDQVVEQVNAGVDPILEYTQLEQYVEAEAHVEQNMLLMMA
jgi:hypothetical protein